MPAAKENSTHVNPSSEEALDGVAPKEKRLKITYLELDDIDVGVRRREELGDIEGLQESISRYGLLQPLVVDKTNKLIAGGRRYHACRAIGYSPVPCVRKDTVTEGHHVILELTENIYRKNFTWQEECKGVYTVHRFNERQAVLGGRDWTQIQSSRLLGVPFGSISVVLKVGGLLIKKPEHPAAKAESIGEAIRIIAQERQREFEAEALKRSGVGSKVRPKGSTQQSVANRNITHSEDEEFSDASEFSGPINTDFDLSDDGADVVVRASTRDLSKVCYHGDSIAWMRDPAHAGSVDHIVTDPPYAIDLEDFIGKEEGGGALGIAGIEDTHQVDANLDLIKEFWKAAYRVTRPHSYVITFACISNWEYCRRCALDAGFKVQEWPLIWHKPNASLNRMAGINFTKNYEVAVVARRENATLITNAPKAVYSLDNRKALKSELGLHPFVKPFGVWEWVTLSVACAGQIVLDPFAGVGSSIETFIVHDLIPIAIELDDHHFTSLVHNVTNFYADNAIGLARPL